MVIGIAAAVIIIIALLVKIYLLKKAAREIVEGLAEKLSSDTNTVIDISSRDKDMLDLADSINSQLKKLRREHLQYHQGNTELMTAITNISHDIRTPLTAIYGYLDMIEQTELDEKQLKYISIMKERAEMMKRLTEELFRYSVIVSEENRSVIETVNVGQVLEDSIMGYFAALSEKGIVPQVSLTEQAVIRELDREHLSRIFSNLLNNALKYSDGDLAITMTDTGVITFSNTAKGLSAVEVEQLFNRFYTVEAAHHSTGLGLSIARTLVERMGGSITAEYNDNRLDIIIRL